MKKRTWLPLEKASLSNDARQQRADSYKRNTICFAIT